jgi:hypothetical protein
MARQLNSKEMIAKTKEKTETYMNSFLKLPDLVGNDTGL